MAKLKVSQYGKQIQLLELKHDIEYTVGRSSDCDVVLDKVKNISRQHLKVYQQSNEWVVEKLSQTGPLIFQAENMNVLKLTESSQFSVPPYDFEIIFDSSHKSLQTLAPSPDKPREEVSPNFDLEPKSQLIEANLDATRVSQSNLFAILKINGPSYKVAESIKLEHGNLWRVGRDITCEIVLKDNHASREHFEISKVQDQFYITDLGSANGTQLNGVSIPPKEPLAINSGDSISMMKVTIDFEIHDTQFSKMLMKIPSPQYTPLAPINTPHALPDSEDLAQNVVKVSNPKKPPLETLKNFDYKKNKVRLILIALVPILLIGLFSDRGDKKKKDKDKSLSSQSGPNQFANLNKEQKFIVKDTFNLARSHLMQGKYELCTSEIIKLHDIVVFYENSKELEVLCAQAYDLQKIQREKERQLRERQKTESQISIIVEDCKSKIENSTTQTDMNQCLAPAIELDPQHNLIVELQSFIQLREDERQQKIAARSEKQKLIKKGLQKYKAAKYLDKKGHLKKAIRAYKRFLASPYPDPNNNKSKARHKLVATKKRLRDKMEVKISKCKKLYTQSKYKEAVRSCDQALKEDPDHEEALELRGQVTADLRRDMKTLYQDSILEESLGNVEAAKQKWKIILEKDISGGEYRKKSRIKLKKYGIGI